MASKLEEELVDKIIQDVRKFNRVTVGKDDPLFSIVTANSLVLEKYIETFEKMLTKHHTDLESMTVNYLSSFRQKTENELNDALSQAKLIISKETLKGIDAFNEKLDEIKLKEGDNTKTKKESNNVLLFGGVGSLLFATGYIVALIVIK